MSASDGSLPTGTGRARRSEHRILVSPLLQGGFHVLGAEAFVVLGRSRACQIPLPSLDVSRRHARITCEGSAFVVEDLGSANGTRVNGERVEGPRPLRSGDVLSLGPAKLTFLVVEATREELAARFDPRDVKTKETARPGGDPARAARRPILGGHIAESVLLEACQLLEVNRRSGELRVRSGADGLLRFRDGLIVAARFGGATGLPAARRILELQSGEYAFDATPPEQQTGDLQTKPCALAMELAREQDEKLGGTHVLGEGVMPALPDYLDEDDEPAGAKPPPG